MKHYVVIWIECDDDEDAEQVEAQAVDVLETRFARDARIIQNRIQDAQP